MRSRRVWRNHISLPRDHCWQPQNITLFKLKHFNCYYQGLIFSTRPQPVPLPMLVAQQKLKRTPHVSPGMKQGTAPASCWSWARVWAKSTQSCHSASWLVPQPIGGAFCLLPPPHPQLLLAHVNSMLSFHSS